MNAYIQPLNNAIMHGYLRCYTKIKSKIKNESEGLVIVWVQYFMFVSIKEILKKSYNKKIIYANLALFKLDQNLWGKLLKLSDEYENKEKHYHLCCTYKCVFNTYDYSRESINSYY